MWLGGIIWIIKICISISLNGCITTPNWIHYGFQYLLEKGDLKIDDIGGD